jgi:para-nitrobenzyl esterase
MTTRDHNLVETKSGVVQGQFQDGLYVFKGIPYAAPPVSESRWLPPQPLKPWSGVRSAQNYGTIAPQNSGGRSTTSENRLEEPQSEDCLYLNIWTPGTDAAKRPVMVWIHGGAFNRGSGSSLQYTGNKLSKRGDTVIVTINYRLGCLGFMHLDQITGGRIPATGNEGLLDQIAALTWVRDNITAFGGDPSNVTVFGESAGAMSIGCLLAMPAARGLFAKAILQSGSNTFKPLNEAVELTGKYLSLLGLDGKDEAALRRLSVKQLLTAQQELGTKLKIAGSVMEPVVDGKVLPEIPIEAVRHGSAGKTSIIVGSNLEEAKFMALMNPNLTKVDEAGLIKRWQSVLPPDLVPDLIENCRKAMAKQGSLPAPGDLALALQTDAQFRIPAIRMVEAHQSTNQPAFNYLFTWKSPTPGLGACHGLDVGFVFGNLSPGFCGTGPEAEKLSGKIQDAWLAFARTGSPSCKSLGEWPQYGSSRQTMILGMECRVENAPYEDERRAWDPVANQYLG